MELWAKPAHGLQVATVMKRPPERRHLIAEVSLPIGPHRYRFDREYTSSSKMSGESVI